MDKSTVENSIKNLNEIDSLLTKIESLEDKKKCLLRDTNPISMALHYGKSNNPVVVYDNDAPKIFELITVDIIRAIDLQIKNHKSRIDSLTNQTKDLIK